MKSPCVYILTNRLNGALYTGVTSNLAQRLWQHRQKQASSFTKKYNVHLLVWYEMHDTMAAAIAREKAIKDWPRRWKLELINAKNPKWADLYDEI